MRVNMFGLQGGIVYNPTTKLFSVSLKEMKEGVKELSTKIMTLQAEGSKESGLALLAQYAHHTPHTLAALDAIADVPTDIKPIFPLANKLLAGL